MSVRVLYSFPHKLGAERIATTAWHQVADTAAAGAEMTAAAGVVHRPLPPGIAVRTTLSRGRVRLPYRALGTVRTLALHDQVVASWLPRMAEHVDVVHTWPLAAMQTLRAAHRLGIPTVLERPNAHTRFAYEVVAQECVRLGVALPPNHEHAFNAARLRKEEAEYRLADYLLCPSEFVADTFRQQGFSDSKLVRHRYGYDPGRYHAAAEAAPDGRDARGGLALLFVGVCAVRKGVHFALEAWLRSPASATGTFTIAGGFLPAYRDRLSGLLDHPSIRVLGHRDEIPQLMRQHDALVLPSIEEGSPLVCMEALGSGCVPLVSEACAEVAVGGNALVHPIGDIDTLSTQITRLSQEPELLARMRAACFVVAPQFTWEAAGRRLLNVYERVALCRPATSPGVAAAAA
jgi:glycosyltransferase involved in cell wall biosynthesis